MEKEASCTRISSYGTHLKYVKEDLLNTKFSSKTHAVF